ncbi:MAG: hypothetical protein RL141_1036 [Candidatus Parcubacteria bacterium]
MKLRPLFFGAVVIAVLGAGCSNSGDFTYSDRPSTLPPAVFSADEPRAPSGPFTLSSPVLSPGEAIPETYTCKGSDFSLPVQFQNAPLGTASLALIMEDVASPEVTNWLMFNIAPAVPGVAEGDIPPGLVGASTNGRLGYEGPCPSEGSHRYVLTLYALDTVLTLAEGVSKQEVRDAMEGHVLSMSTLEGTVTAP